MASEFIKDDRKRLFFINANKLRRPVEEQDLEKSLGVFREDATLLAPLFFSSKVYFKRNQIKNFLKDFFRKNLDYKIIKCETNFFEEICYSQSGCYRLTGKCDRDFVELQYLIVWMKEGDEWKISYLNLNSDTKENENKSI